MSEVTQHIVIDPGHGGTGSKDRFRKGPSGEREEWINLRVSLFIAKSLKTLGYKVSLTRDSDSEVGLADRVRLAENADLFLSVHHNASDPIDPKLDYPCLFVHGSVAQESQSLSLAKHLAKEFSRERSQKCSVFSDQLIFNEGLFLLREMHETVPAVISEFSFFSEPSEEKKLKTEDYCRSVALAYVRGIEMFFEFEANSKHRVKPSPGSFMGVEFWSRLIKIRNLIFESEEQYTATEYGLMAQDLYNKQNYELAIEQLDKSLALLRNGPYLASLMELAIKICHELKNKDETIYKNILQHGVIDIET